MSVSDRGVERLCNKNMKKNSREKGSRKSGVEEDLVLAMYAAEEVS